MRIKFCKGLTPEAVARAFVDYIRDNNITIGAVNMYIQTYGPDGKADKYSVDDTIIVCSPTVAAKMGYIDDVAKARRKSIKAV